MRRIMSFEIFESVNQLTEEQVEFLNRYIRGSWKLNQKGKIDIEGDFDCSKSGLKTLKGIQFGVVRGGFYCSYNFLETLEGAPEIVGGDFNCSYNSLTLLKGSPENVGGSFYCHFNSITSLEGGPSTVGGGFYCYGNSIKTLEGAPEIINEEFDCRFNSLVSLEGAPKTIGGDFKCSDNYLATLEGAPEFINGGFYSNDISVLKGKWSLKSWLEILELGSQKQKKLIFPLVSSDTINTRLREFSKKTAVELKGVWNSPGFADIRSQLIIPKGLEGEMDLLGDLDGIGL
jgi:hypothetical protein